MSENNKNTDALVQEYFDNHYDEHRARIARWETVKGRMEIALEKSDGSAADIFFRFFEREMNSVDQHAGKCLIYMPDFGIRKRENRKGKIIIETDSRDDAWTLVKDCFELQLRAKTDLSQVKIERLQRPTEQSDDVTRYYNMFVSQEDAIPLVQRVLFCSFFRQRFLMTTESRVLGSMTTQRFLSNMGQVFSFRACALKE